MDPNQKSRYDLEHDVHRITLYSTVARAHQHISLRKRLTLHLDMNCFYAQVEQRAWNLYGLPLAMGGWRKPDGTARGIVATASYEARQLGIKTAMSAFEAARICPWILFMQIDYDKYRGISRQLQRILERYAPDVEKYSMDEYFLDITFLLGRPREEIVRYAARMKREIYGELGLVCSVGIARSKTWAKLASGQRKPDGLLPILHSDDAAKELFPLPLDEVWGIGSRRYRKLQAQGLHTISDAFREGPGPFRRVFGEMQGQLFHEVVTGNDRARVLDNHNHVPDEVSYMHTFSDWSADEDRIRGEIAKAVRKVCYRLRGYGRKAIRWGCHIRYQDSEWRGTGFTFRTPGYTNLDDYLLQACLPAALQAVRSALRNGHTIRGIGLHTIEMRQSDQTELFFTEEERMRNLYRATDLINNLYGLDTIRTAAVRNSVPGNTHFVNRS